jgi:AcrR family transcriptional regulator
MHASGGFGRRFSFFFCSGDDSEAGQWSVVGVYSVYMPARSTSKRIAVAARRLLDKEGVEAVTMRRVAAAVGITAMAVYRHYADRKALLNALADEGFEDLTERLAAVRSSGSISGRLEERLTRVLDVNLTFGFENPRLFELMFLTPREGARQYPKDFAAGKSPTANLWAQLIEEGMASGYFRKDDVWAIVFETGALMQGLMMLYLGGRVGMSATRFRAFCHQSMRRYMHGIRT